MTRVRLTIDVDVPSAEPITSLIAALDEALLERGCELLSPVNYEPRAVVRVVEE